MLTSPSRTDATGTRRCYVRFVALGDSATYGVGDKPGEECRGWSRLLVGAMGREHDVSSLNLAVPGACASDVRFRQLREALEHRPHVASLIVGLNDVIHTEWNAEAVRRDLLHCAEQLTAQGAVLMTARFHDHTRVFRLPKFLARPMRARIDALNAIYDEIHDQFGGIQLDLATHPGVYDRQFWSIDRLHPSELGHRALADEFAGHLAEHGLTFDPPGLTLDVPQQTRRATASTLVTEVAPWLGRRLKELAPLAVPACRSAWQSKR
jgi:lysophospholipase L1-like esterase